MSGRDPEMSLNLRGNENYYVSFGHLQRFVTTALVVGYEPSSWVQINGGEIRVTRHPDHLTLDRDVGIDLVAEYEDMELQRNEALTEMRIAEERVAALEKQLAEAKSAPNEQPADEVASLRKQLEKLTTERDKAAATAVANGNKVNSLTAELKEAQKAALEPKRVLVGEAEQVQAIERLLLGIGAHRASSHGGRMIDTGDQILYDLCDEISKQFSAESAEVGA